MESDSEWGLQQYRTMIRVRLVESIRRGFVLCLHCAVVKWSSKDVELFLNAFYDCTEVLQEVGR